jgi:Ca2+-binding RTX toxin-like protein
MTLKYGTNGNDKALWGTSGKDSIYGLDGNDRIITDSGEDYVDAGDGDDEVNGYPNTGEAYTYWPSTGNKTIYGGSGNDFLVGGSDNNLISGDAGNDRIYGQDGNDKLLGGDGNDYIYGYAGTDTLDGGSGDDYLHKYNEKGFGTFLGGPGNDTIHGSLGDDIIDGGEGIDNLNGYEGNDTYYIRDIYDFIYDSAGNDIAYVSANFVKIPSSIEKVFYTNGAQELPYWISALLPDEASGKNFDALLGEANTFLYFFPTSQPSYDNDTGNAKGFKAFTPTQIARTEKALTYVSTLIDVNFQKATNASALNTFTFATNDQTGSSGYASYPSKFFNGSDIYFDDSRENIMFADSTYGAYTMIHEIGHGLGLKHPFDEKDSLGNSGPSPYLQGSEDSTEWTVMTYELSYFGAIEQYFLKFSDLDIAALQYMYGPSKSARAGNDTYKVSQSTGNFIWDGSGEDVIDLSNINKEASVYLTPGYWGFIGNTKARNITSEGQITVNFGTVIENLIGSKYSDKLFGNDINNSIYGGVGNDSIEGWLGDDLLFGETGNDQLVGGGGNDVIDGGTGTDTVVFTHNQNNYSFYFDSVTNKYTVINTNGKDGIDTLLNVEFLKFADRTIGIDSVSLEIKPPPNIEIRSNSLSLSNLQTATITFTLSESSDNFIASDVIVSGGTLSKFTGDGVTFTALFTPTPNSLTPASISVPSGAFTNSKGVPNIDGTDANNMLKISVIKPVIVNEKHDLSIISYKNIKLGGEPVYLKGIIENLTYSNGVIASHTIEIDGSTLDYFQVDGLIQTVTRDGEFTQEFTKEINDYLQTVANITYKSAVALVGVQSIDGVILFVAGSDGYYVN